MAERAVLTTGANSGIGLATVIEVARRGFRSIGSVRSDEKAEVVAKPPPTPASRSTRSSWTWPTPSSANGRSGDWTCTAW